MADSGLSVVALDDVARRHVAEALRRYFVDLRRDGFYRPPAQLAELQAVLSGSLSEPQEASFMDGEGEPPDDDGMLTREGAARLLQISVPHLDRLVAAGEIPSRKLGRRRIFSRAELEVR